MPLTPGSTFERYEIAGLVGRGGMGEVYRATDTRLGRTVALKVLRTDKEGATSADEAGGVARLLREARTAAALNHPHSVAIYELGEAEGIPYIAMEFVQGASLRRYIGDPSASLETKVAWLIDAARALWAAHKAGIVHRDVKPSNIMVSEEGVVKVLDFGLAKPVALDRSPGGFQTQMGQVLGTPRYMAPEQLEGSPADATADQFGFGLTAYELISGIYPGGPLAGAPTPLDQCAPGVTPELAAAVARMMARSPHARFSTMEEAAHALRTCVPSLRGVAPSRTTARPSSRPEERQSEAPTRALQPTLADPVSMSGAIPVDVALDKNKTLPLATPMKLAVGAGPTSRGPVSSARSDPRNRTLPLSTRAPSAPSSSPSGARPPSSAPSSGNVLASPTSGVYASQPHAHSSRSPEVSIVAPGRRRSSSLMPVVIAVFLGVGLAAGALAAWLVR